MRQTLGRSATKLSYDATWLETKYPTIMSNENTNDYTQLCVWPGTSIGDSTATDFESFFLDEMKTRVRYYAEVKTQSDIDESGNPVPDTGGRNDIFFYVHTEDIPAFAVPRLKMGIRWWEDVVGYNDNSHLYTEEFLSAHPLTW